jgi:hypothetical protein
MATTDASRLLPRSWRGSDVYANRPLLRVHRSPDPGSCYAPYLICKWHPMSQDESLPEESLSSLLKIHHQLQLSRATCSWPSQHRETVGDPLVHPRQYLLAANPSLVIVSTITWCHGTEAAITQEQNHVDQWECEGTIEIPAKRREGWQALHTLMSWRGLDNGEMASWSPPGRFTRRVTRYGHASCGKHSSVRSHWSMRSTSPQACRRSWLEWWPLASSGR